MSEPGSALKTRPLGGRGGIAGLARVFVAYGFRAAPWWMMAALVLSVGTALASVFYPVGIKVMVDAFLAHDRGGVVLGAGTRGRSLRAAMDPLQQRRHRGYHACRPRQLVPVGADRRRSSTRWRGSATSSTPST